MKTFSVIFLNRVYPPAGGATGQLLSELAPALARRGHRVTVVTSKPDPASPRTETVDGVRVERVGGLRLVRTSHWRRALSYLALYPALLWRLLQLPRSDIVVTLTDPPLLLLLGPLVKWIKRCRLVHWSQDIYPEVAEELGVLRRGGGMATLCRKLSTWAARKHERIIVVGRCMKERFSRRGLSGKSIEVIPNWAPQVEPIEPSANAFRREHSLEGRFVVMYSGNLGLAHPFAALLDAADHLQRTHPEVAFLIVGTGPRLPWVTAQIQQRSLGNVRLLPPQPGANLAQSLSAADLHLITMDERLCGLVVPSKLYGALAVGRPCVFVGPRDSEVALTLAEFQCGSTIGPSDGRALAECIVGWSQNREQWGQASARATEASRNFRLNIAVNAFQNVLTHAVRVEADLALQHAASRTTT